MPLPPDLSWKSNAVRQRLVFAVAPISTGFSLIEVVLAIGLVAFALLVILALMPGGLASLQDANRQIIETDIYNTVEAELSATPFNRLDSYLATRFPIFFDNEGAEVPAASAVFTVRCTAATPELGAGELRRETVSIGYHFDPATDGGMKPSKRSFLLVNKDP